jgi:hypothetical protein
MRRFDLIPSRPDSPHAGIAMRSCTIFEQFGGNCSVTLKGSLTPVTPAFRIQTKLFWNVTARKTKREQGIGTVNETLRKALCSQA